MPYKDRSLKRARGRLRHINRGLTANSRDALAKLVRAAENEIPIVTPHEIGHHPWTLMCLSKRRLAAEAVPGLFRVTLLGLIEARRST